MNVLGGWFFRWVGLLWVGFTLPGVPWWAVWQLGTTALVDTLRVSKQWGLVEAWLSRVSGLLPSVATCTHLNSLKKDQHPGCKKKKKSLSSWHTIREETKRLLTRVWLLERSPEEHKWYHWSLLPLSNVFLARCERLLYRLRTWLSPQWQSMRVRTWWPPDPAFTVSRFPGGRRQPPAWIRCPSDRPSFPQCAICARWTGLKCEG